VTELQLLHSQIKTVLYKSALFSPQIHRCLLQSHCSHLGAFEGQEDAWGSGKDALWIMLHPTHPVLATVNSKPLQICRDAHLWILFKNY
jgi:hypothetical protein